MSNWGKHHAMLYVGDSIRILPALEEESGVPFTRVPHSDISYRRYVSFGIDEARELKVAAQSKPITLAHSTFVLALLEMTREAQHALLKLFEDPPKNAQFVLIVPNEGLLIATLRSRLYRANVEEELQAPAKVPQSATDAFEIIAKITKNKDTAAIESLLLSYEAKVSGERKRLTILGKDVLLVRSFIRNKGASSKMLLEHLALSYAESGS